jgi:glycolate oxidase
VLEIDLDNRRVCVEPGVTNVEVRPSRRILLPADPSSQIVCSNRRQPGRELGGAHCFKYGFTTNYVCGLELVLPTAR